MARIVRVATERNRFNRWNCTSITDGLDLIQCELARLSVQASDSASPLHNLRRPFFSGTLGFEQLLFRLCILPARRQPALLPLKVERVQRFLVRGIDR